MFRVLILTSAPLVVRILARFLLLAPILSALIRALVTPVIPETAKFVQILTSVLLVRQIHALCWLPVLILSDLTHAPVMQDILGMVKLVPI